MGWSYQGTSDSLLLLRVKILQKQCYTNTNFLGLVILVLNFEGQHPIVIIIKDIDIEIEFHKKKIEKIKKIKQDIMQELLTSRTCLVWGEDEKVL